MGISSLLSNDFYKQYKTKQSHSIISQTAKDLIKKNLFPDYAKSYLLDPSMLKSAAVDFSESELKSWVCPHCRIEIKGPKEWIIQHLKIHHNKKHNRENEVKASKVRPYY